MTELDDAAIEPNLCPALKVDAFGVRFSPCYHGILLIMASH